ncbi:MAG: hydroxymethylglutaryl-CoA reductase [Anaerolineae bacterium]
MNIEVLPDLLQRLYTFGSLNNISGGVQFSIKNRLVDTSLLGVFCVRINHQTVQPDQVQIETADGALLPLTTISPHSPLPFGLATSFNIRVAIPPLSIGRHEIELGFVVEAFGELVFSVEDHLTDAPSVRVPRSTTDDYADGVIHERQRFVQQMAQHPLEHITHYSFDPHTTRGNIENLTGAVQIPLGFAGPIRINGEHAQGEFLVPLATTEGTLVASYNRGIKVLNLSGGVQTTVVGDAMQRAPVFVFGNAREAREFVKWVLDHLPQIKAEAESTSSVARLQYIDPYLASKFAYLRFNFTTGDAAGQNMVGRATFAACNWIIEHYTPGRIQRFYLESNFATDKKASQVNILHTRGKRVTAEAIVKRDVLLRHMRVETESMHYHSHVATVGAFLSGANNNGAQSPNAITALFIATGQDVANVSESSAGVLYTELCENGDLYVSLTIPSLIVATYGGGTGLATQRECLEVMGCYGKGKVNKLAEIVAGVALAGEISLGAAISASDWVSSHEQYGRNR